MAIGCQDKLRKLSNADFPDMGPITDELRRNIKKEASRYRGSVRLFLGNFWTNEEYEKYREKVLSTPLP